MGKKKSVTEQKNTFAYIPNPGSADIDALRTQKATIDPGISYNFAKGREALANSYQNPLGAQTSAATRDAASRVSNQSLAQAEAQANAESQYRADDANFQRQGVIAGMTAPTLQQTGGTSTNTTSGGFWSGLLANVVGQAAGAGAAMMTGGASAAPGAAMS